MLRRDSAPMATEWGPVASWAGVVVTFLGFVGAIAALKVQRAAVDVTVEQHNTAKDAKARAKAQKAAREAQTIKEQDVSAVSLDVFASYPSEDMNPTPLQSLEFSIGCTLNIPKGERYKHVKLTLPEVPEEYTVIENTTANLSDFTVAISGVDAKWLLRGGIWPHGPESQAKTG